MTIKKTKPQRLILNKKKAIIIILIVAFFAALYFSRSYLVVAFVNRRPVTRWALDRQLEKVGGQQTLNNMITEMLINQEAKKQNITVSQADLDQKFTEIDNQLKKQGQSLESLLLANNETRADFDRQMKIQVLLEKMLGKDINITEEEMSKYFNENKNTFNKNATLESEKENIKNILFEQKLSEKLQPFLNDLQSKAKIIYILKLQS